MDTNVFRDRLARRAALRAARVRALSPSRRPQDFARDEDGALTLFSLYMVVVMVMCFGLAVDLMRQEFVRTDFQYSLDRAALAAADLDQTLDPEEVAYDFIGRAGYDTERVDVTVSEGLNYRTVAVEGSDPVEALLLNLFSDDFGAIDLTVGGNTQAEERIMNNEISLILDISGSMRHNSKLANMQEAARQFVDTVIVDEIMGAPNGLTTLNIIPYHATVNTGANLLSKFTTTSEHSYNNCIRFADNDFNSLAITTTQTLQRLSHFDRSTDNTNEDTNETIIEDGSPWCKTGSDGTYGQIMAWGTDRDTLKTHIGTFQASGNTAIDLGLKWGVGLLDPAANGALESLITDGDVASAATGRPTAYSDNESVKVVVLMTDGVNTTQYDLKSTYRTGMSPFWYSVNEAKDGKAFGRDSYHWGLSVYDPQYNDYYSFKDNTWYTEPFGDDAVQISHVELFHHYGIDYIADDLLDEAQNSKEENYDAAETSIVTWDEADARLLTLCTAAKAQGIVIYTVGFETTSHSESVMSACATTPNHFFAVDGVEITEAFSVIARSINKLRLTQ